MSAITSDQVRALVLSRLQALIVTAGLRPEEINDDLDMLTEGLIDSMGIVELITSIERDFGVAIDFAELDPENLTIIGPFCRYVAEKSRNGNM
ncbi:MAG TPA: acyl carrier protein [Candidatus Dormibacteraeota bacterium]|nr:acyl carrier protein [Candidatus Dormibacteraeota bacterium]